nr:immunoglobulin heavy chain junction region [Mus musculus]
CARRDDYYAMDYW